MQFLASKIHMETLHPAGFRSKVSGALSYAVSPVIYSLAIPILAVDVWLTAYQWICFTVYGIPKVRRRDYIVLDRHRLQYLSRFDRLNCDYCAYANGVLAYAREIAARTEQYWCPIRNARQREAPHARYAKFLARDDSTDLPARRQRLREDLLSGQ